MARVWGRIRRAVLTLGLAVLMGMPGSLAHAGTDVPGTEAAEFQDGLALWLSNDEQAALPALAAQAAAGNIAAQLLLGVIDRSPALQGPWLAHLPRGQRIDVLRRHGGISGRSWLHEVRDHPIAAAWLTRLSTDAGPDIVPTFAALGEERAAREAFAALLAREHPSIAAMDPATVESELLYLLWSRADATQRESIAALIPEGHPQRLLIGDPVAQPSLIAWLETSPAAQPIAALCASTCAADEQGACLLAAYGALPSHLALLTLGSPVEGIIPQDSFVATPRGQSATLRRMLLGVEARGRRALIARVEGASQCLGTRLAEEQRRYMYKRPTVTE